MLSRGGIRLATGASMQMLVTAAALPLMLSSSSLAAVALDPPKPLSGVTPLKQPLLGYCPLTTPHLLFDGSGVCRAGSSDLRVGRGERSRTHAGSVASDTPALNENTRRALSTGLKMSGDTTAKGVGKEDATKVETAEGDAAATKISVEAGVEPSGSGQGEAAMDTGGKEADTGVAVEAAQVAPEPATAGLGEDEEEEDAEDIDKFWFHLTESTRLCLMRGDLTKWHVDSKDDAIVNAANERMLGGGGVDGAIHRAAGDGLYHECLKVPLVEPGVRCPTGRAVVTGGHHLPVKHVVHTVGPVYNIPNHKQLLGDAYRNSLLVASQAGVKYVAFPAISCGIYGYPYKPASEVALSSIKATLESNPLSILEVHFVFFEQPAMDAWLRTSRESLRPANKRARA